MMREERGRQHGLRRRPHRFLTAILICAAASAGLAPLGVLGPRAARAEDPPPTLRELPAFEVPDTVRVEADLMTLREIIARSVEGEKTKLAGHQNIMFTAQIRSIVQWKKKRLVEDAAVLFYEEDNGFRRAVRLAEERKMYKLEDGAWAFDKDEKEDEIEVRIEASDSGEGLATLPFYLEDQQEFSFSLLGRYLEEDHVIFKIGFKPRSDFKPLPSGTVYVDTDDFRIIHEEFTFDGQNPFPLLLKDINRVSRQWRQLATGEWVPSKVMAEIDLKGGWMRFMPDRISVAVALEDYRFNQPYNSRLFGER